MPKVNRCGQSSVWNESDLSRFFDKLTNPKHRLFAHILFFTGERISAIAHLKIVCCYESVSPLRCRDVLLFPASTRKRGPNGKAESREVPVNSVLKQHLEGYSLPDSDWLFPSPRNPKKPVTTQSVDSWFRRAYERAGLSSRGHSLHSFRRTFITDLHTKGVALEVIRRLTGHKSLDTLKRYIDVTPDMIKNAIELL